MENHDFVKPHLCGELREILLITSTSAPQNHQSETFPLVVMLIVESTEKVHRAASRRFQGREDSNIIYLQTNLPRKTGSLSRNVTRSIIEGSGVGPSLQIPSIA